MSKGIIICKRQPNGISTGDINKIKQIGSFILPDNIKPKPAEIEFDKRSIRCIYNPVNLEQMQNGSICIGHCPDTKWSIENSLGKVYDGSYALFKDLGDKIELQTDSVASRTIWYYYDDSLLIASNSQLAIIYYLQEFEFNDKVIPWMLATGTLGYGLSWDKRIKWLPPQTKLELHKNSWKVNIESIPIKFEEDQSKSKKEFRTDLSNAISKSIENLPFQSNQMVPLSGGYDSRGILLHLQKKLPTITWGSKNSRLKKNNDAYIAKILADALNFENIYLTTDNDEGDFIAVVDRFVLNSEGRIDHIAGYMDGFRIWKYLFNNNIDAIIRGDEGFGWKYIANDLQARLTCGLFLVEDFPNLKKLTNSSSIPDELSRKSAENIEAWRDRIYHQFRLPIILGALNETKSGYVEIINPLLSHSIMQIVRSLPPHFRNDKLLFKEIVNELSPSIPYASVGANIHHRTQLKNPILFNYFKNTIKSSNINIFDEDQLNYLFDLIDKTSDNINRVDKNSLREVISRLLPSKIKAIIKKQTGKFGIPTLDNHILLFRVFIIYKINLMIQNNLSK